MEPFLRPATRAGALAKPAPDGWTTHPVGRWRNRVVEVVYDPSAHDVALIRGVAPAIAATLANAGWHLRSRDGTHEWWARDRVAAPVPTNSTPGRGSGAVAMSELIDRLEIAETPGRAPAWTITLDGAPLLHLSENHVAVNDLRASHMYRWGIALLREPWSAPPELASDDRGVRVLAGRRPVVALHWDRERPALVGVEVFDFDRRLLDIEVRYRELPTPGTVGIGVAAALGR